jgi:predicted glutamate--cysteine ligase
MHNVRHLWTSVRPNGPQRPTDLNRLELRICDLITDPALLLAVTALMELRVLMLHQTPERLDPFLASSLSPDDLQVLCDSNDAAAARSSLDADLCHWSDGRTLSARSWISDLCSSVMPLAKTLGLEQQLDPIHQVLTDGNQAMRWLAAIEAGSTIPDAIQAGIAEMARQEQVNSEPAHALG